MKVLPINNFEVEPWLLEKHYAKRMPQIMFAFGLYNDDILVGVVTYGIPASPSLCMGICGKEYSDKVSPPSVSCSLFANRVSIQFKSHHESHISVPSLILFIYSLMRSLAPVP